MQDTIIPYRSFEGETISTDFVIKNIIWLYLHVICWVIYPSNYNGIYRVIAIDTNVSADSAHIRVQELDEQRNSFMVQEMGTGIRGVGSGIIGDEDTR